MLVCAPLDNVEGSVAWKPRQASHQVSATTTAYTTPEDRPKAILDTRRASLCLPLQANQGLMSFVNPPPSHDTTRILPGIPFAPRSDG